MPRKFRIAYLSHSLRSDWNNGNAHFLRGLLSELGILGHDVTALETVDDWSIQNLRAESDGDASLHQFAELYPDLHLELYNAEQVPSIDAWRERLRDTEVVILHEWNLPALAHVLLDLRENLRFKLLFHDTHHRASSSPESIQLFGTNRFDGVLAFGEALRSMYRKRFGIQHVWTLHEAADTRIFHPLPPASTRQDVVWIGNWGDDERSAEIRTYLLEPAARLPQYRFTIHGVRYPQAGIEALQASGVAYRGYLSNLEAPRVYAESRLTVHVPRQQYSGAQANVLTGIPTIRVFEALACGIPLLSAPWQDTESLFREGDFRFVFSAEEMRVAIVDLLEDPQRAAEQAQRGLDTVLARHTCRHRAEQVTSILEELFA
ncbi:MAG: CgeB family protein [Janthinobacterium lividum]